MVHRYIEKAAKDSDMATGFRSFRDVSVQVCSHVVRDRVHAARCIRHRTRDVVHATPGDLGDMGCEVCVACNLNSINAPSDVPQVCMDKVMLFRRGTCKAAAAGGGREGQDSVGSACRHGAEITVRVLSCQTWRVTVRAVSCLRCAFLSERCNVIITVTVPGLH